ncbi:MAG: CRISPR-associated endonuclease Cas2 [Neomegalonema sp.]|nr:CRISPR-associated endonuclease Cas2 [Neomegalonema sp.]
MTEHDLFLIAYDIPEPRRGQHALRAVRGCACGGQYSAHEVAAGRTAAREMRERLLAQLDLAFDRLLILRLDPRSEPVTLGLGTPPDPQFLYIGE